MKFVLLFNLFILLSLEAGLATMETIRRSRRSFELSKEDLELYTSDHHSIEDYDFTTPVYVQPKPIINKRSVDSELITPQEREVKFNAFGEQYHARLQPNHWLLRQGLIVERVGSDGAITEEEISGRDCYYFAHLISHMGESAGALSTCNGLRGLISHDDTDVYITPLKDHHAFRYRRETQDEFNGEQPHIVYKRTSRRGQQTSDTLSSASSSYDHDDAGDDHDDDSDGKDIYYTYDETSDFDGSDTYSNATFCEEVYAPEYSEEPDLYLPRFPSRDQGSWEGGNMSHPGPIFADRMAANQEEGEHLQEGQRYIELFVIVDDEMVNFHQDDLVNYTLAVLNILSRRYTDPSLQSQVRMAIVKIVVAETKNFTMTGQDGSNRTLIFHSYGTQLVKDLCSWQFSMNPSSDDDPLHFDNTILITRRNLYSVFMKRKSYGLLGKAPFGTICQMSRSCNINQDEGLEVALTIAHELGHNLNLHHDPLYGCANGRNIMSSEKTIGASTFKWSSCSSWTLAKFFTTSTSNCLRDRPSLDHPDVDLIPIDHLVGTQYTRLQHCRKAFGNDVVSICGGPRKDVTCGAIGCKLNGRCRYAAAIQEGTACGTDMWCYDGFCRSSLGGVPFPVDGAWGEWPENYTQCSRTCGSGVKYRRRKCDNPAPFLGGKACEGIRNIMETCNKEPCPGISSSDDFRDHECALTNPDKFNDRYHEWSADLDGTLYGNSLCDLKCKSNYSDVSIRHPSTVSEGTRCWVELNRVPDELRRTRRCVGRECKAFGCDGVYGSDKLLDGCGICGGTERTCRFVQGNRQERLTVPVGGFWHWTTVPIGATMVKIDNLSINYQGLRLKIDGKIIMQRPNKPKRFTIGNIHILFRSVRNQFEQISILNGPTTKPIQIDVMHRSYRYNPYKEPSLIYEWYEPIGAPVSYPWQLNPLTECPVSCGGGYHTVMPICMEDVNGTRVNVSEPFCLEHSPKPSHIQECNTQVCPGAVWLIGNWSQCSMTCDNDIKERFVDCIEGSTLEVIPTIECVIKEGYRSNNTMPCSQPACPTMSGMAEKEETSVPKAKAKEIEEREAPRLLPVLDSFHFHFLDSLDSLDSPRPRRKRTDVATGGLTSLVASKTIHPSRGGTIQLPHHGISLCIPALALQKECTITLKVLLQPSSVLFAENEVIVSPGVVCEPSGTTFASPLKLVIPHCAVLTDPSKAKVTLYFTHGDMKVTKEELSSTGTPRCVVRKDDLEVYINHFSICEMFMVISDYFIGKRVASTPYLPKSMSRLQPQYCHLRLYNDTPGLEELIEKEERTLDYLKMASTQKMFVLWEKGELKIRCEVDSGYVIENEKTVSLDDIYRLDRKVVSFLVGATGNADVHFKFNFHPHCDEGHAFKATFSDGDIAPILQPPSTTTSMEPKGATSSSTEPEKKEQIRPKLPATPIRLDDILLYDIAEEIETDEHLDRLMQTLEVTQGSQSRYHELNRLEGRLTAKGTRQMLMDWRARTAVAEQRDRLKDALTRAGLLDMRDRFFPG